MRKLFFVLILVTLANFAFSQNGKFVCFTCDDLPYTSKNYSDSEKYNYITDNLLNVFKKYNISVLGSVNSGKLFTGDKLDSSKVKILEQWLDAGMLLGNHTYAHKNYNKISFAEFKEDILNGEIVLKELLASKGFELKYFRHPFLFRGDTKEKADSLQAFLDSLKYLVAPVTIDNSDYIFSWAYEKAKSEKNDTLMKKIGTNYISYMEDVLHYYENQSIALLGYNIKHILLFHANLLNADYIEDLVKIYLNNGYEFINLDVAMSDVAYKSKDEFYKKAGITWLHRWALTQGKRGDFFKGEPEVPAYIEEYIK